MIFIVVYILRSGFGVFFFYYLLLLILENFSRRLIIKLIQSFIYGFLNVDLVNDGVLNIIEKYCVYIVISYIKVWLQVDLGKMFSINNVKIFYRNEGMYCFIV